MSEKPAAIVSQSEARVLHAFDEEMMILLDGERTAGSSVVAAVSAARDFAFAGGTPATTANLLPD